MILVELVINELDTRNSTLKTQIEANREKNRLYQEDNERIEQEIDQKFKDQVMIFNKTSETLIRRIRDYEVTIRF